MTDLMRTDILSDLYLSAKSIQIQGKVFPEFVMPEDKKLESMSNKNMRACHKYDLADLLGMNRIDTSFPRKSEYNSSTRDPGSSLI